MNYNTPGGHYSSGCESGWTMYLDQSSYLSENQFQRTGGDDGEANYRRKEPIRAREVEEEEDLSMVSDASSGPPHYHEDNEDCFYDNGVSSYPSSALNQSTIKGKQNKKKVKENHHRSFLDDTASSPVFGHPKKGVKDNVVDSSQAYSATHSKRKSALKKHFGFSFAGKSSSKD